MKCIGGAKGHTLTRHEQPLRFPVDGRNKLDAPIEPGLYIFEQFRMKPHDVVAADAPFTPAAR